MDKKPFLISFMLLVVLAALSSFVLAQGTTSRVTGTVTDTSGATEHFSSCSKKQ